MHFYYEGEVSEELIELWQCAVTEASDLESNWELDDRIERLDYPQEIPSRGRYAYLRKEPSMLSPNFSEVPAIITREIKDFHEKVGVFISPVSEEKVDTSWGVIHYAEDKSSLIPARPISLGVTQLANI
ncbi:MAG TPA: hypothetical protein VGZ69_06455 [Candidatus Rhabdochlamydia sp.]|jgi:hypothetical protein|nr:hypothetical protein [Candidatus Rhabdochlamydia sp.]